MGEALRWHPANRRYLEAALGDVRSALAARLDEPIPEPADVEAAARCVPGTPALERLCRAFELTPFERLALLLCAGVELDARVAAMVRRLDPRGHASFSLALAALPDAHWSATAPTAPLRRWSLVELGEGEGLVRAPLRIDERALHYLVGISYLDPRLEGILQPRPEPDDLPPSQRAIALQLSQIWRDGARDGKRPLVNLTGADRQSQLRVVAFASAAIGFRLHHLSGPEKASKELARIWEREAILQRSVLAVDAAEAPAARAALEALLAQVGGLIVVCGEGLVEPGARPVLRLEVAPATPREQRALWVEALGDRGEPEPIDRVVAQFDLSPSAIEQIAAEARGAAELWPTCRERSRPEMEGLAQRITSQVSWDDLVLPEAQKGVLEDMAANVRQRFQVYEEWGFAARGRRGLGISALFSGPSGTGKTLGAEVLANALDLDLYRIDLSAVVSKYIGETEKNLKRVFDAAERGGGVLLFDEADALFGKRSEVKDSHDRHANIEVSYLLQRMEAYRGLALLTTNLETSLDTAFLRRIRFVVRFPFPRAEHREAIWRRVFPADAPTQGLAFERLARLKVAGGNIRNIALQGAFLAADAGSPIRMSHLARAARVELIKIGRAPPEAELRSWT